MSRVSFLWYKINAVVIKYYIYMQWQINEGYNGW